MSLRPTTETFEGDACPRCGSTLYYAVTGGCVECRRAYNADAWAKARAGITPAPPCDYQIWRAVKGQGKTWRACQYPATMTLNGRLLCTMHHRVETAGAARLAKRKQAR